MTPKHEDYRVKNAREGKAVYIPGKSVEEMRAELARASGSNVPAPIQLSKEAARAFADRIEDVCFLLDEAETAFGFLARLHQGGDHDDHKAFGALNVLCARALKGVAEAHAADLEGLVKTLRTAGKVEDAA